MTVTRLPERERIVFGPRKLALDAAVRQARQADNRAGAASDAAALTYRAAETAAAALSADWRSPGGADAAYVLNLVALDTANAAERADLAHMQRRAAETAADVDDLAGARDAARQVADDAGQAYFDMESAARMTALLTGHRTIEVVR